MNKTIVVNTETSSYPIYFESDFVHLADAIQNINCKYSSFVIISDTNVSKLYQDNIQSCLQKFNKPIHTLVFEAGEEQKNLRTIETFIEKMIQFKVDRKSLVIALGGGVVGDMAGFVASIFMRGIDFIQIPTSLLAQVDSSVGGKTGIDFQGYKNILGAFYQPKFVYINVNTLSSLPKREFSAGMSEVIKHAFIKDLDYFHFLNKQHDAILALDHSVLKDMIYQSCQIKRNVVNEDEKEQGVRALLNFGHTIGHAIERLKGFELVHGECVSIGMHGALLMSQQLGYITQKETDAALALIQSFELPIYVTEVDIDSLYNELYHDKKTTDSQLKFVLINSLGTSFLESDGIDEMLIKQCLEDLIIE